MFLLQNKSQGVEELRRWSARDFDFGRLFWEIRDAVVVTDAATQEVILWNPGAVEMFGYTEDEALGMPLHKIVPDRFRHQHREGIKRFQETGEGRLLDARRPIELVALRKDGNEIPIELTLARAGESPTGDRFVVAIVRELTERKRLQDLRLKLREAQLREEQAHIRSMQDDLTGLYNRAYIFDRLNNAFAGMRRRPSSAAVLFIDLDGFKEVNDTHGHEAGDAMLIEVAGRLKRAVRPTDAVGRLGGDEFVVVAEQIEESDLDGLVDRVRIEIAKPWSWHENEIRVDASVGRALSRDPEGDASSLIREADRAMYEEKRGLSA